MQLEDYNEEGILPISAIKECFETLDIDLTDDLLDFIIYVMY
jgi:hypothetical protein